MPSKWSVQNLDNGNRHTLGEWGYKEGMVFSDIGCTLAHVRDDADEGIANGILMAAAPNLLAACREALEFLDNGTPICRGSCVHDSIRAAIARATEGGAA